MMRDLATDRERWTDAGLAQRLFGRAIQTMVAERQTGDERRPTRRQCPVQRLRLGKRAGERLGQEDVDVALQRLDRVAAAERVLGADSDCLRAALVQLLGRLDDRDTEVALVRGQLLGIAREPGQLQRVTNVPCAAPKVRRPDHLDARDLRQSLGVMQ